MKTKLNNLVGFNDFTDSWKAEQAKKTKRTETGLDVLNEGIEDEIIEDDGIEEIIPEGLPEENFKNHAKYGMGTDEKIETIKNIIDNELEESIVDEIVNYLREVLLEMEQGGFIDDDFTDKLDDEYDDWNEWIKAVLDIEDLPEEALNGILEIVAFEDEDNVFGGYDDDIECPDCEGEGIDPDTGEECEKCDGTGRVDRPYDISPD